MNQILSAAIWFSPHLFHALTTQSPSHTRNFLILFFDCQGSLKPSYTASLLLLFIFFTVRDYKLLSLIKSSRESTIVVYATQHAMIFLFFSYQKIALQVYLNRWFPTVLNRMSSRKKRQREVQKRKTPEHLILFQINLWVIFQILNFEAMYLDKF